MKNIILAVLLLLTLSITVLPYKSKQTQVQVIDLAEMSQLRGGGCGVLTGLYVALGGLLFAQPEYVVIGLAIAIGGEVFCSGPGQGLGNNGGSPTPDAACPYGGYVEEAGGCQQHGGHILGSTATGGSNMVCCED